MGIFGKSKFEKQMEKQIKEQQQMVAMGMDQPPPPPSTIDTAQLQQQIQQLQEMQAQQQAQVISEPKKKGKKGKEGKENKQQIQFTSAEFINLDNFSTKELLILIGRIYIEMGKRTKE